MELILENKRRGRKIISHHTAEGTRESHLCVHDLQHPWLESEASSWIANHGHSDGIPLSPPQCGDRFDYSCNNRKVWCFRNELWIDTLQCMTFLQLHHLPCRPARSPGTLHPRGRPGSDRRGGGSRQVCLPQEGAQGRYRQNREATEGRSQVCQRRSDTEGGWDHHSEGM